MAQGLMETPLGVSRVGCNGTRDNTIGQLFMEQKACKIC
jgi:hypothetical protein